MLKSVYLPRSFFVAFGAIILLFALSESYSFLYSLTLSLAIILVGLFVFDAFRLFGKKKGLHAQRICPKRLSNGDANDILISVENRYNFKTNLEIIDEAPVIFQMRDNRWHTELLPDEKKLITYQLRPEKRGEYTFGNLNILVSSPFRLLQRRFVFSQNETAKVYPSFLQMRKFEIAAFKNNLAERGLKKLKKLGHSMEFDQIKNYVIGDDTRTLNWKATARRNELMVNQYQDEKSQQVYCIIDKGRMMRAPFDGLSLLDYAINATLVFSNIAVKKEDKVGLITFSDKMTTFLTASNRYVQIQQIMEALYNQKTLYKEANFELTYTLISRKITQRSLLVFFTNFESHHAFKRQLRYLHSLAKKHLVVVVFFENTGLKTILRSNSASLRKIHHQAIAEQFALEKSLMLKSLKQHGIIGILSEPKQLTVNTLNAYLEIKAKKLI